MKLPSFTGTNAIFLLMFISATSLSAQTGKINVRSQPPGALIWIDDQDIGITPVIDREINAGVHTLRLTDPTTNATRTQSIEVTADSTVTLNVIISGSTTGYLTVESTPPGAEVALVTVLGKTPVSNTPVNPGAYAIRLEPPKKRYCKVTQDVIISENNTEKVPVTFPKNKPYIRKTATRILLGVAATGLYSWGLAAGINDHKAGSIIGFSLGTVCLIGVEIFSF